MEKIQIEVDEAELASMSRSRRIAVLGELAAIKAEEICPAPQRLTGSEFWSGRYDETSIVEAFKRWAETHDGLAPSKRDWSRDGDPSHRWPRAGTVCDVARKLSEERGVHTSTWAPHRDQAKETTLLIEAGHIVERHEKRISPEIGEPGYCVDCAHGSGCMPPDKSPWQFAVEDMAGLSVRRSSDMNSTPSQLQNHGRNRQMVTAGQADVRPSRSDPAAREAIEIIEP